MYASYACLSEFFVKILVTKFAQILQYFAKNLIEKICIVTQN